MDERIILALTIILAIVTGQQIINFEKAKSLRRDPEKGIFYAVFKSHLHHRLDIFPLATTALQSRQECAQRCAENTNCFAFNLASVADVQDKLRCELLPSDIYNRSDKFGVNPSFHHFSIKVRSNKNSASDIHRPSPIHRPPSDQSIELTRYVDG